ncbi:MAG: alpha/beta fold hydrolase [Usitatibacter sp.]
MSLRVDRQGRGRDLLLVHGWGLHSGVWQGVLPNLAAGFRVHRVDLPGYGASRAVPARGFDDAVDLLAEALPDGAIVCGWSLGAQLALALARRAPRRVGALALVSATPCFVERPGWDCAMDMATFDAFDAGLAHDADATLARFIRLAALNGVRAREAIRGLAACLHGATRADGETLRTTLAWLRDVDLRAQVRDLRLPVVAIHGEADAVTAPAAGRWLANEIPGARFIGLPGCAHAPFITHREAFVAAIESLDG